MCFLTFTEINTGHTGEGPAALFKASSKAVIKDAGSAVRDDEEKGHVHASPPASVEGQGKAVKENSEVQQVMREPPRIKNTFSWQNIKYVVNISGKERQLLDGVSGYVEPGKLTALMGESGAGKVKYLRDTV